MTTAVSIPGLPQTLAERAVAPDIIRVKATFADYLAFARICPYPIQYINGEIVSMGQATLSHESLVGRLITLLNNHFDDNDAVGVFASNIKIFIQATGDSVNADVTIVRGRPDYFVLPSGRRSTVTILNPELVVEILSNSTKNFDLGDKLAIYRQVPSLQQILFVNQHKPEVISYVRDETAGGWLTLTLTALTDAVEVLGADMALANIYKKMKF